MVCVIPHRLDRMSPGQTGHFHRTKGTCPRDGCGPEVGVLVAHPCGDPNRYTVSRIECRIEFPQNQRCRAKIALHPPKSRCRTFLRTPLSHFPLILPAGRGRGGLVEGIAALLGSENGSRSRGVSQLQSHQSRYSVQLRSKCTTASQPQSLAIF